MDSSTQSSATGIRRRPGRRTAVAALAVAAATALGTAGAGARSAATPTWGDAAAPTASTVGTSAYTCFVTYPGGSTNVSYSLSFTGQAPDQVGPYQPYIATVTFPTITPNPNINQRVADVTFRFRIPAGATLLTWGTTGGSGVDDPEVRVADGTVTVEADGPFPAATPFQFPTLRLLLLAGPAGTESLLQQGANLSDPAFSWERTDPAGTQRPFACFLPAGTTLTSTVVG
jgi:dehydratase